MSLITCENLTLAYDTGVVASGVSFTLEAGSYLCIVGENGSGKSTQIKKIKEELETKIEVGELIDTIEYDYPTFHLSMDCFWAEIVSGELVLTEHEAAKWLTRDELDSVEWLPADITLIDKIRMML